MAIPKIIHYCWFGRNPKGKKELSCIESWKKYCPDFKIIEWNEENYDVQSHPFIKKAYERKKWAFVSDLARLDIIYRYGGVYLDTDVEILKPIDDLLSHVMFVGFETSEVVNFGLGFGAEKAHPYLKEIIAEYNRIEFPDDDSDLREIACPIIQTAVLKKHGLKTDGNTQKLKLCDVYEIKYFSPKSFQTGKINITPETYSIHHFNMSWLTEEEKALHNKEWTLQKKYNKHRLLAKFLIFPDKIAFRYRQKGIKGVWHHLKLIAHNMFHKKK